MVPGAYAQPREIDSLRSVLNTGNDTTKVLTRLRLSRHFANNGNPGEAIALVNESLRLSRKVNYHNGIVLCYNVLANYHVNGLNDFETSRLYLDSAEALADSPYLKRQVYYTLGMWHSRKGEFNKGHEYWTLALKFNGKLEDGTTEVILSGLGYNLSNLGRYKEAMQYHKRRIAIAGRNRKIQNLAVALSIQASLYLEMNEPDSAIQVFKRLYQIELKHGNPLGNPTMLTSLGKSYQDRGDRDSAYYFLHLGLHAAYEIKVHYAIVNGLEALARFHLKNRPDSALYFARKLYRQVDKTNVYDMNTMTHVLALVHGRMKHFDSAYYYQNEYIRYHDSLFQEKQSQQIAQQEAAFDLEKKQTEIQRLEAAQQNEIFARNAFALGMGLMVIMALLIFFILRGRIQARKKEIETKNWQLDNFTRKMVEKSELVEELRSQIEQFKSEVIIPRERIENVTQILNSSILTEDDWEQFKLLFEQVHRNFFAELRIKHPGLTAAEIRIAALLKLNLSTREMASMLGISVDSVNKARYRLRKKLDLHPEQDLQEFIESVSEPESKS